MNTFKTLCTVAIITLLCACEKLQNNNEGPFELNLVGDTGVFYNEPLKVLVQKTFSDYSYEIYSPKYSNGIAGSSYNIDQAGIRDQGWYKVFAYGNDKIFQDSTYVKVIPEEAPCNPTINKLTSNTSVNLDFGVVNGKIYWDDYEVLASTMNGNIAFTFSKTNEVPIAGTYNSKSQSGFNDFGDVSVKLYFGAYVNGSPGQKVHVSKVNGKTYITLCDFLFKSSTFGDIIVNTKLELE